MFLHLTKSAQDSIRNLDPQDMAANTFLPLLPHLIRSNMAGWSICNCRMEYYQSKFRQLDLQVDDRAFMHELKTKHSQLVRRGRKNLHSFPFGHATEHFDSASLIDVHNCYLNENHVI